ncbi:cytochrome c biogenesis CcdA family protein [Cohnella massiliensis]|uniref:cytochrome c biogenesis CcdA family protein n=1 Tax=Cohnella massiliensis TaxID=1816691 RepID=UPI0009BA8F3A|nr:cytochrome c biogenesis protein CcdA [Cohnella massiliensis]
MLGTADVSFGVVFVAGVLSFLSPCCLPLYPTYLSYLSGVSVKELQEGRGTVKRSVLPHALCFIAGFSIIFYSLGLSASFIGRLFAERQDLIRQLGGLLIVITGLIMLGIFKPKLIMKEKRWIFKQKSVSYVGSFLVGITYAAGWTPCVGPILAAVLAMGVSEPAKAIGYTTIYSMGFAVPFLVMAFLVGRIKWLNRHASLFMKIGGVLMIITGVLLYTDQMSMITRRLIGIYGGFRGF